MMGWKYLEFCVKYLDFMETYRYERRSTDPDLAGSLGGLHGVGKEIPSK